MNLDTRTKKTVEAGIIREIWPGSLTRNPVHCLSYEPGNGTLYCLIFTNITGVDDVGDQGGWLVTWINSHYLKAMVVTDNKGLLHWRYVMEKMRASISDAVCLAEIIGHCTGRTYITCEEVAQEPEE